MEHTSPSFLFALALGAGVTAQIVARHLGIPAIVLLLATGVMLGPDVLGVVHPSELGDGLFALVSLAVAIILFEGGLNLDLDQIRRAGGPIRMLISVGALVTAAGGAVAAATILGWDPALAILFGTLVIVTGPTVIRPLLRGVPLRPRLATVLEAEGLLIDPVGAIIAGVTIQAVLQPSLGSVADGAVGLVLRGLLGGAAGLGFGFGLVFLLRSRWVPEGLENLVALGGALVAFEVCESFLAESGILAVTVAGVVVGNLERHVARELGEFQEHLTIGLIGMLFVLLAADVRLESVFALGVPGLLVVVVLSLVVRPIGVAISTWGAGFDWRERAFLSWVAPRGVVAAAIASLAASHLDAQGMAGGDEVRALVFLTIAITVVVQGGTAGILAGALGVRAPGREAVAILGAEELGFALAEVLGRSHERIVFVDSNPGHCLDAEERGYPVVYGNALEERTLARMRLERARIAIGLTANNEVNQHFALDARDAFGVREIYLAISREGGRASAAIAEKQERRVLFDRPKDVERWAIRFRHGQAEVREFVYAPDGDETPRAIEEAPSGTVDPFAVLAVCRNGQWEPMHTAFEPAADDRAAAAIYLGDEEAALAALLQRGWRPAPEHDTAPGGEALPNDG